MSKPVRPIAIYLPQFHPIPENNEWWGKGFTEWTNVAKAQPRFEGHYQPHLPADLGFYDLRLSEAREEQARLAQEYGIYGFCYYHYWFSGKRVLERPLNEVLRSGKPDIPFCLCWANENWTRRWDGKDQEVLLKQNYSEEDDRQHMHYLCSVFADQRYIRIDGKPLFIVYRTELFPDILRTVEIWREEAMKQGIGEIYLARMESFSAAPAPAEIGFDAAIEFQPNWKKPLVRYRGSFKDKLLNKLSIKESPFTKDRVIDYNNLIKNASEEKAAYKRYRCVAPMWDNSARRKSGATIFHNSTPELYGSWLSSVIQEFKPYSKEENFIFINAWNEWAEGNHLEPCQKWGRKYLEATKSAINNA